MSGASRSADRARGRFGAREGDDPYPNLREVLVAEYADLPPEDIKELLTRQGISAEDAEDFWGTLKDIGGTVARALPSLLPVAGTVVGTAFGGPVGAALGGTLGQLAGGAIGSAVGGQPAAPGAGPPGALAGLASTAGGLFGAGGGGAAGQLLGVIQRPEVLRALMSIVLGNAGRQNVPVGPPGNSMPVPVSAFANLLGSLANRAAAEHNVTGHAEAAVPLYLLNARGEFCCDPAVPEQRAARLLELLHESDRLAAMRSRAGGPRESAGREASRRWREDAPEMRQAYVREQDEMYDELELAELLAEATDD